MLCKIESPAQLPTQRGLRRDFVNIPEFNNDPKFPTAGNTAGMSLLFPRNQTKGLREYSTSEQSKGPYSRQYRRDVFAVPTDEGIS